MQTNEIATIAKKAEKTWKKSYNVIWPIINKKKYKIGVEIGVAFGGHSEKILSKTTTKLYCVDPYKHINEYVDPMNLTQADFESLYKYAKNRLSTHKNRCNIIRKSSIEASKLFKSVDFVYIDGDHSLEGFTNDLLAWYKLVRVGGLISGHDYGHPDFPGIKKVVDKFFGRFNIKVNTHVSGVWWVEKVEIGISYIMPVYNAQDTIVESVNSILNGNFSKFDELIIVDDASTDSSYRILSNYSKKRSIKLLSSKINQGGGSSRNKAVSIASNELIFCLDSDNLLKSGSVYQLKNFLLNSLYDIASFKEIRYFQSSISNISHKWVFSDKIYDSSNYLSSIRVPGASGNYLYTKNSWITAGRYPEDSRALDAWGFGLRQVMSGNRIGVLPNSYYYHRVGHNSYWTRESKKSSMSLNALQIMIPYLNNFSEKDVDYIFSKKGRSTWLDRLDTRNLMPQYQHRTSIFHKIKKLIKRKI